MKRKFLILFILTTLPVMVMHAQKVLTLKECYERAYASTALAGEETLYSDIWELKDKNLSKSWLPTLDANGSFLYNSSVIDIGSTLGSTPFADAIKPLPHEQYKITMDINQVIYDGGVIKNSKSLEKAELSINHKQTETDLYKLRSQINTYYFNLLLLDRQKELLNNYMGLIDKRIISLQSAVNNGIITKSDIDVMTSEKIKISQQISENEIQKSALLKILSSLTGSEIDASVELILPVISGEMNKDLSRPELEMFDLRKEQLGAGLKVLESKRMPKAFGFATLGYGNPPGNNFFKDEFAPFYILGAGVKWNIFDWNKTKNEKQVISLQQGIIEKRKSDLADNFTRLLEAKNAEIEKMKSLIESDTVLMSIRKRITSSAESQYENGTITATELLNEMNSERQTMINYEIHKISLSMAQVEYMNISGKGIE
jgi:outer membrane protein TolC